MIRPKTCFVAEGITVDRDTNQVSAYSVLENVEGAAFPMVIPRMAFICFWERSLADPARSRADFTVTVDGVEIAREQIDVDFGAVLRNRSTIRIDGLTLAQPASIVFRIAIPAHGAAEWAVAAGANAPGIAATAAATAERAASSARVWDSGQLSTPAGAVTIAR